MIYSLPSQKILPFSFFTDQDLIQTFGFLIPVALPMVYAFARGGGGGKETPPFPENSPLSHAETPP
ncbi:hypothetical protein, partial [uncultured Algoriphagus sp.]|uniref:hypothetical protein n=1 Tax=uncultured Algoriphagus sp. TaxID=417365 RepID=UPI002596AD88